MDIMEIGGIQYVCPVCKHFFCTTVFSLVKHLINEHIEDLGKADAVPPGSNDGHPGQPMDEALNGNDPTIAKKEGSATPEGDAESFFDEDRARGQQESLQTGPEEETVADCKAGILINPSVIDSEDTPEEIPEDAPAGDAPEDRKASGYDQDMQLEVTENGQKKSFQCGLCLKLLLSKRSLNAHLEQVHELYSELQCEICPKAFISKLSLQIHINTVHLGHEDLQCQICSRSFTRKSSLLRHVRTVHENMKDHQCELCLQSFGRLCTLKKHVERVHDFNRDLECEFCHAKFKRKSKLIIHVHNVHKRSGDVE